MKPIRGSIEGAEFDILSRVFKATVGQDWFERSLENEKNLAIFMVRTHQQGITDEATLRMVAEAAAKQRYSKGLLDGVASRAIRARETHLEDATVDAESLADELVGR